MKPKRWLIAAGVAACGFLPLWAPDYVKVLAVLVLLWGTLGQMWNLLAGYLGIVSLGFQTFIGIGGFWTGMMVSHTSVGLWICFLSGGLVSALCAAMLWGILWRLEGGYFAVATWMISELFKLLFSHWSFVGYGQGLFIKPAVPIEMDSLFYASFILTLFSLFLALRMKQAGWGRILSALRDDPIAAEAVGIDPKWIKGIVFTVSGGLAGAVAGIYYTFQVFIQPTDAFSIDWTIRLVFIVIIGGMGSIFGPFIGAALFLVLTQMIADTGAAHMVILGSIAVASMFFLPDGIVSLCTAKSGRGDKQFKKLKGVDR
jgi:branched-chain amino acid transport system permease protein